MYSRILVPTDGSPTAQRGLEEAIALARMLGASLRILHVVEARRVLSEFNGTVPPEQLIADWRAAGEKHVDAATRRAREAGANATGAVRCDPGLRVFEIIVDEARASEAGLIVMGTHGRRGLQRMALGSDAEMVVRDSPVPVLLVKAPDQPASA